MNTRQLIKIIRPYCDTIVLGGSDHWRAFPKGSKLSITFASSPRCPHWYKNVIKDFKRRGIIIKEFQKQ